MNDETKKAPQPLKTMNHKNAQHTGKIVMAKDSNPIIHTNAIISPTVDVLLNDAKSILAAELAQYRSKVARGLTLNLKEARVVQGYLDTLIKMQKEEREQAKDQDLSDLSDIQLLREMIKIFGVSSPEVVQLADRLEIEMREKSEKNE